jgi:hypothetical protein
VPTTATDKIPDFESFMALAGLTDDPAPTTSEHTGASGTTDDGDGADDDDEDVDDGPTTVALPSPPRRPAKRARLVAPRTADGKIDEKKDPRNHFANGIKYKEVSRHCHHQAFRSDHAFP